MKINWQARRALAGLSIGLAMCSGAAVQAQPAAIRDAVAQHNRALRSGDRPALIEGYADDVVMIRHGAVVKGKGDLAALIAKIDFAAQGTLRVDRVRIDRDVAIEDWTRNAGRPNETHGRDVFVFRDGKIAIQIAG